MTQYFETTYVPANPKSEFPRSTCLALYIGPNPPQANGIGTVIAYAPPVVSGTDGTAQMPCFSWDAVTGTCSNSTFPVSMSQDVYNGLGNVLYTVHLRETSTIINFCTGGIYAVTLGTDWSGLSTIASKASNSANFAKWFLQQANYLIENPLPNINDDDDIFDIQILLLLGGAIAFGGGPITVVGIIAFAYFAGASPAYGAAAMAVSITTQSGSPSPPVMATISPNGKWGNLNTFTGSFITHVVPNAYFLPGGW